MRLMFWISALVFSGSLFTVPVHAEESKVSSFLYSCNLSFHASGKSIYLGVGYTDIEGKGMISCYDFLTGATQHIPVKVTARGPGAGVGMTGFAISGGAVGIGVSKGPEALLGRYTAIRGNAAVGVGLGAATALRLSNGSATIDSSLQGQTGLGVGVDLLWVDITADGEKRVEAAPLPPSAPTTTAPIDTPVAENPVKVIGIPAKILYVQENQPVHLVDSQGRLLQVLYLRQAN